MKGIRIALVIAVLLVAAVFALFGVGTARSGQSVLMRLFAPFMSKGKEVAEQGTAVLSGDIASISKLDVENKELKTELRELRATIQLLRNVENENKKLRDALDYRDKSSYHLIAARVIARDASTWWNVITINRGFEDGVEADMPVLTEDGLVGKTLSVTKNEAKVLLLTDESCKVAATIAGSPEKGIVSGLRATSRANSGRLQMNFLPKNADLQPGQKVYSAGVRGALFPAGILLGTITEFNVRSLDGQAILSPAVDVNALDDVFVLLDTKK